MIATANLPHLFTAAAAALSAFTALSCLAEDYPMQGFPLEDARWQNTLTQVNASIAKKAKAAEEAGKRKTVEILQHIEGASYLAQIRTPPQKLGSAAVATNQIFGRSETTTPPGEWETVRLDLPKSSKTLTDGEKFLKSIEETEEAYQYTTTLGAKATVKVCRLAGTGDEYTPLTMEQFVTLLKAGETWDVTVTQITKACGFCGGAKTVNGAKCPQCKGVGGDAIQRTISIRW